MAKQMRYLLILFILMVCIGTPAKAWDWQNDNGLQDWNSLEELEFFLDADDTDRHLYLTANAEGIVYLNNQCEDRAFNLRDRAEVIGKRLETEILDRGEYFKWYGVWLQQGHYHMINKAVIGNEIWYIEPDSDKHWLALYLD